MSPESRPDESAKSQRRNRPRSKAAIKDANDNASRFNGTKHGMRSEVVVLDREERSSIEDHHERWNSHYRPQSPGAQHQINVCIYTSLLAERCTFAFQCEVNRQLK